MFERTIKKTIWDFVAEEEEAGHEIDSVILVAEIDECYKQYIVKWRNGYCNLINEQFEL